MSKLALARKCVRQITAAGISIYDHIEVGGALWMSADLLEAVLQSELAGNRFEAVALRTRSKLAKSEVCRILGYPVPKSFRKLKAQARFPGQNFDTYVQSADNLQIWNAEISPTRRYVLIRPDAEGIVRRVRVVSGADLAPLDRTGKLTRKFQARITDLTQLDLASEIDTLNMRSVTSVCVPSLAKKSPIDLPEAACLMSIRDLFTKLSTMVGRSFENPGVLQDRNRGGLLHSLVSAALGYGDHADNGRFPDIRHQLLEVKLQTSPTIDLGAISPDSHELLEFPIIGNTHARHQDVRYAVFCGAVTDDRITLTGLVLVTGKDFFATFEKFGGLVINNKYQLKLPSDFFHQNTEGIFD